MRFSWEILRLLGGAVAAAIAGCGETGATLDPLPRQEGGTASGLPDAASDDGQAPVVRDAGRDAPLESCSPDGFCVVDPTTIRLSAYESLWGDGAGAVWLGAADGALYTWDGARFQRQHTFEDGAVVLVQGASPTDLWVLAGQGVYHGAGPTAAALAWEKVETGGYVKDIFARGVNDTWILTADSFQGPQQLLHVVAPSVADGGVIVSAVDLPLEPRRYTTYFERVFGTSTSLYVTGYADDTRNFTTNYALLLKGDGAGSWVQTRIDGLGEPTAGIITQSGTVVLGSGCQTDSDGKYAISQTATVAMVATDGTQTLTEAWNEECAEISSLWGTRDDEIYAAGRRNLFRRWDGTGWSLVRVTSPASGAPLDFSAVWGDPKTGLWLASTSLATAVTSPTVVLHRAAAQNGLSP